MSPELQLGATYSSSGAEFTGVGFRFSAGRGSLGRHGEMHQLGPDFVRLRDGGSYGQGAITDSFRPTERGIEQAFHIAQLVGGTGPLVIDVPVSGLTAVTVSSRAVDLKDSSGQIRATYTGLRVTDAVGHVLVAEMQAVDHGHTIAIEVDDAGARYPLTVDPTWSDITGIPDPNQSGPATFAVSVALSGTTAVVGAIGQTREGEGYPSGVYVFNLSGGTWSETTELTVDDSYSGNTFGDSVAISGNAILVGAPGDTANGVVEQGAAYVFNLSDGTWSQTQELTPSDGEVDYFGSSVALSGTTAVVGAYSDTIDGTTTGAAYVFNLSDGTWSQTQQLSNANATYFGLSVALSGTTIFVGAPATTVGDNDWQGAVYVFKLSDGTWSQATELTAPDGTTSDEFGDSVALFGTTAIVGAPEHMVGESGHEGAAYAFNLNGGTWSETTELIAPDGGSSDEFGASVALSGTTAMVGAQYHTVNGNFAQGAAYVFSQDGGAWPLTSEVAEPDGEPYDFFGSHVALSGTTALVAAPLANQDAVATGVAYVLSSNLVQPQGTEPGLGGASSAVGNDGQHGGSPSVAAPVCKCGEPVDVATGDFYENATDLSLPGAGIPLSFSRSYDAQSAQEEVSASAPAPPLGYGWAYNLGMTLTATATTATVTEDNGAQVAFAPYVSGTSPAWCTSATNFCSTAPRVEATLNQNSGGTWSFVRTLGTPTTFTFSSSGALTEIADQQGDTLSSSAYSPSGGQTACPSGDTCTAWTSSASGRELVLAYNSSGELASVFDANSTLAATFAYSGSGCTTWSGSETAELCKATGPGDIVATYTYDSANSTSDLDYDMLTLTPPGASAATTNVYNSSGQVTQQTDPSGAVTTFSYAGTSSSLLGGTTTITNYPLGTGTGEPEDQSVYQFSNNVLVDETTGSGTSSASTQDIVVDPVSLLPLSSEDGDGNVSDSTYQTYSGTGGTPVSSANVVTSTDAVGNTTAHAYNSFNQAWCTVEPAEYADGVTCPSTEPTSPPAAGSSDPYLGVELSFYNSSDQLTATTDALGNTTKYSYTSGVSGVPNGLEYCSVGPVAYQADVACPAYGAAHVSGTITSTYDSAGDLTSSTDADGNTTSYVYAATGHPGLVSSETDPDGTTTAFTYNGAGEVTTQVASFASYSATTAYAYDAYGRQFCTVVPYEYAKGVTCPSSPPGSPPTPSDDPYLGATITTYDADGRVVQVTNPLGGITYNAYDQAGELFCTVAPAEAALGVTCPSSAPTSPPTIGDDPYLGATIMSYDANGRSVQVTNPLGGITLTSYDPANNVLQTTVESNNSTAAPNVVTSYSYDADNRVVSTTADPGGGSLSATTLQAYDPDGNVFCSVSANAYAAGSSAYQCPPWQSGWVSSPPSPSSLYSSTPTSAQADNVTTTFDDVNGDQLQSTDPDVHTSVSVFDGDGRNYCSSDPTNVSAWLTAHSSGTYPYLCPSTPPSTAPAQGSNPGYVTTIFDAASRVLSSTDQLGDTTSYTYSPGGEVLTTTNPRGYVTTNCYYYESATGQCAHGASAGGGSADDLYSTTTPATSADPSGEVTDYTYYPGDQPDTTTTPAGTETDAYDADGDLTSVDYSSTASGYTAPANVSYTYNVDGTTATLADATGTTTYGYDRAGDVTSQVLTATATDLSNTTTSYGYFSTGALASVTYPAYSGSSDPKVNYTYDAAGAMVSGTDWEGDEVTFAHDGDGNQTAQDNNVNGTYPDGTSSTTWSYDAADNTASAASSYACTGGSETLSQSFSGTGGSINPDGQLTQYSTSYAGSCSAGTAYQRDYSYDLAGRVVYQGSAAQGSNANNFAYDPAGDPTKISSHDNSGNFDTYSQVFDGDGEVTAQSPVSGSNGTNSTYAYDTLGDQSQFALTGTATTLYGYDQVGQLASATTPAVLATYLYNGDGLETRDQVSSPLWGPPTTVDSTRSVHGVSCPTTSFCAAVDTSGYATTYNGASWATPSDIDGSHALEAVSCTSSSFCKAVDNDGEVASYNGTSWSVTSSVDSTRTINAISCPTTSFCAAVDNSGYITTYNGTSWATAADKDGSHALEAVSCTSSSFCVATDNDGNVLTYNGSSWSSATSEDSTRTVHGVSCPTTSFCAAVDTSGYATTYNGTSWSTPSDIDGSHALEAVSCTSSSYCEAVDNDGNVLTSNGTSWSADQDIDSTRTLNAISCTSPSSCVAVDASGYVMAFAVQAAWGPPTTVDSTRSVHGVSCPTTSFCAAVDTSGYATTYNGTSWSTPSDIDGSHALEAMSCTGSSFCKAVDNDGEVASYNGTSWSVASSVDSTRTINAISCPTTSFCAAVDNSGYITTYNGTSWATAADKDGSHALEAVSCTSSSYCVATDNDGNVLTYNGTSWSSATSEDSTRTVHGVSCPTTSFCAAVDTSGYATTYNGSSWSTPSDIDGSHAVEAVSCTSSSFCVATDNDGNVLTYNGTSWSADQDIDSTRTLNAISCASPSSCTAVDASGYDVTYAWSTATSQLTWDATGSLPLLLSDGTYDYIYGPGTTPVEQISLASSTPTYLTYTQADSTWLSTNATGDKTGFWGYDAFGNLAFGTPTSAFGYAGQYIDATTGLSDMRARWYAPGTGEFTSVDPDLAETGQPYTYAGDDPVNEIDPSGLCWPKWACGAEHAIGGAASTATGAVVSALEQTPIPGNPFSAYAQDKAFVDNVSEHGLLYAVNQYNPLYQAVEGYSNEISAVRSGCSLLTELTYGFQGAVGAASFVGVVGGGAEGASDLVSSADWNSGFLGRLTAGFGDDTGAVGPGTGDLSFARKVGLNVNSLAVVNRNMIVQDFIGEFLKGSVRSAFPKEYLTETVGDALRAGDSTVRKLLTSRDYLKGS